MPVYGSTLAAVLGGAAWLAGAVEACDVGAGDAEPPHALNKIAITPNAASGDHLVVRDMHSSSNGSLAGMRRMRIPRRSVRSARVRPSGRRSRVPGSLARVHGRLSCV